RGVPIGLESDVPPVAISSIAQRVLVVPEVLLSARRGGIRTGIEESDELRDPTLVNHGVVVDESDVVAPGELESEIVRGGKPEVFLVADELHPRERRGDIGCRVGRRVVDHDYLEVAVARREDRLKA